MDREEILAKSRKENNLSDERAQYIGFKGANFAITILIPLWVVLSRLAPLEDTADYTMGLLVTTTCFANFLYQFRYNRTKTVIFFTVLFFLMAVFYLVLFLKFVLHVF